MDDKRLLSLLNEHEVEFVFTGSADKASLFNETPVTAVVAKSRQSVEVMAAVYNRLTGKPGVNLENLAAFETQLLHAESSSELVNEDELNRSVAWIEQSTCPLILIGGEATYSKIGAALGYFVDEFELTYCVMPRVKGVVDEFERDFLGTIAF